MIDAFKLRMPTQDAITRGLAKYAMTKKVTLWLCFISQIFLDVQHVMRHGTLSAFGDLRMSGLRIQKTVDDYLQLSQTHPQPKFWPREGDKEIRNIKSTVQSCIVEDLFQDVRVLSKPSRVGSPPEKHSLLSQHAILCGLIQCSVPSQRSNAVYWPATRHSVVRRPATGLPAQPRLDLSLAQRPEIARYGCFHQDPRRVSPLRRFAA